MPDLSETSTYQPQVETSEDVHEEPAKEEQQKVHKSEKTGTDPSKDHTETSEQEEVATPPEEEAFGLESQHKEWLKYISHLQRESW